MYAVIKTGGKQYRVAAQDKIQIEKLEGEAGGRVLFEQVLMVGAGDQVEIGAPFINGAIVVGEIASQDRGPKIIIFKKRRRKHYRRRNGHRQDLTSVTITDILTKGEQPKAVTEKTAPSEQAPASPLPVSGQADDISLIGGIGPKIHKALTALGVNSFAQIAAWTPEEIVRIETEIKQKGRVAREEWVEQARELLAGKPPRAKTDRARTAESENTDMGGQDGA